MFDFHLLLLPLLLPTIICSEVEGGRWGETGLGWWRGGGVSSPIMPSGTITPVTFRNLTFSPGGVERRGRSAVVVVGRTGWATAISPAVLVTAAPAATDNSLFSQTQDGECVGLILSFWIGWVVCLFGCTKQLQWVCAAVGNSHISSYSGLLPVHFQGCL